MEYDNFYEQLWGSIPSSIVSEDFMILHKDVMDSLTYDLYRLTDYGNMDISLVKRITEAFCFHLIRQMHGFSRN